jgi:hypothetical protein
MDKRLAVMTELIEALRVPAGSAVDLKRDHDPGYTGQVSGTESGEPSGGEWLNPGPAAGLASRRLPGRDVLPAVKHGEERQVTGGDAVRGQRAPGG